MARSLQQRIVITGVGVVSSLGIGKETFWNALRSGVSGFSPPVDQSMGTLPIPVVGQVRDFEPGTYIRARKSIKLMCRETQIGCASASLAMDDATADPSSLPSDRFGVLFGSEMLYGHPTTLIGIFERSITNHQLDMGKWGESFTHEMSPLWLLNYLPNMPACHMGIAHRALGPCNSIVQGDVSGLLALMEAVCVIQRGWADVMLAGSVGNMICPTRQVYLAHDHLVGNVPDPDRACRPFDATSGGVIPAEGAASLLVETMASAKARTARPYAEILGFARGWGPLERRHQRSHQAIAGCLRRSLEAAGLPPDQIGHVHAHGSGSLEVDRPEAQAIAEVLGDVPVTAVKSSMGHAGAGCGALEIATCALALHHQHVPPILHFTTPDPACPIRVIRDAPMAGNGKAAVVISHSVTGQIAALVLGPV